RNSSLVPHHIFSSQEKISFSNPELGGSTTMVTSIKSLSKKVTSSLAFKVATRVGFLLAPQLVLMAIGVYDQVAHAQGLVGAPVDPRYGQSNEVGQLADFGYDTARDISRVVT